MYVKHDQLYHTRDDDISSLTEDYETLWREINCKNSKDVICGVIYRYLNCKTEKFIEYISSVIERVLKDNKLCLFMGDFNIDFLNFDTCSLMHRLHIHEF